jgi:hypothetical protein
MTPPKKLREFYVVLGRTGKYIAGVNWKGHGKEFARDGDSPDPDERVIIVREVRPKRKVKRDKRN